MSRSRASDDVHGAHGSTMACVICPTPVLPTGAASVVGRPRKSDLRAKRDKQIRWVYLVLSKAVLVEEAARALEIDRRTIARWVNDLLGDGEADTEGLRRLFGGR